MNAKPLIACVALLTTACGNWSNKDVEFLNALPKKGDLSAATPDSSSSQASPLGSRKDGLSVNTPSELYRSTHDTAQAFNAWIDALLTVIEKIASYPPSKREEDRRVWGPYDDPKNPGLQTRMVMERPTPAQFTYHLDFRWKTGPMADEDGWSRALDGDFLASAGIRKGQGGLTLWAAEARAKGLPTPDFATLQKLDIDYATDADPVFVSLVVDATPALPTDPSHVAYQSRRFDDGRGRIDFTLKADFTGAGGKPDGQSETLGIKSAWVPSGEGRVEAKVLEGAFFVGLSHQECWDSSFLTQWYWTWGASVASGSEWPACAALAAVLQ